MKTRLLLLVTVLMMASVPSLASAQLSAACYPAIDCPSGQDPYFNSSTGKLACQPTITTTADCGAPTPGYNMNFSCDKGCFQTKQATPPGCPALNVNPTGPGQPPAGSYVTPPTHPLKMLNLVLGDDDLAYIWDCGARTLNLLADYVGYWKAGSSPGTIHYSDGNVGIGTTSPGASLTISNASGTRGLEVLTPGGGNTHFPYSNGWNYISGNGVIFRDTSNVEGMRYDASTGNVGIGTTSIDARLDVVTGNDQAIKGENNAAASTAIWGVNNSTGGWGGYFTATGSSGTGVYGSGGAQGAYFTDSNNTGRAYLGYGNQGIWGQGSFTGATFVNSNASIWADIARSDGYGLVTPNSIWAGGNTWSSGWIRGGSIGGFYQNEGIDYTPNNALNSCHYDGFWGATPNKFCVMWASCNGGDVATSIMAGNTTANANMDWHYVASGFSSSTTGYMVFRSTNVASGPSVARARVRCFSPDG